MALKSIVPFTIVPDRWWKGEEITDLKSLRPQTGTDLLLIVGDASGVFDDLEQFLDFGMKFDTMAINYSIDIIPWPIQHFIAGDSHMPDMQRLAESLPQEVIKHCWNPNSYHFDVRWMRNGRGGWNGTTANLGIKIGIALDYLRIVLAGIPMDDSGNWYAPYIPQEDVKQNKDHRHHLWKWTEIATRPFSHFIRSMSGNTMDLFGRPTKEWLTFKQENGEDRWPQLKSLQVTKLSAYRN